MLHLVVLALWRLSTHHGQFELVCFSEEKKWCLSSICASNTKGLKLLSVNLLTTQRPSKRVLFIIGRKCHHFLCLFFSTLFEGFTFWYLWLQWKAFCKHNLKGWEYLGYFRATNKVKRTYVWVCLSTIKEQDITLAHVSPKYSQSILSVDLYHS